MLKNVIAVIGAGQIGSRHLQSLALINQPVCIEVLDLNNECLDFARERFEQIEGTGMAKSVRYFNKLEELSDEIKLVIVATSANVRKKVIMELLQKKKVQFIILEKVVFQSPQDFFEINKVFNEKGIKAWINCPRRMWPFYQQLKAKLKGIKKVDYLVSGANSRLGLGCNGIHFMDLYAFLTDQIDMNLYTDRLDSEIFESKRAGFIEITGTIYGKSTDGGTVMISAHANNDAPILITIQSDALRCIIREEEGKAWISEKENKWQWQEIEYTMPYQSQLTHLAVQDILSQDDCKLTSYHESWKLHDSFLKALILHLSKCKMEEISFCPIT
ncbi:Oxidoreductase family, NAD-binding Rossmann fold [Pelosinus fermentans]|uniref:Gfo/Idh/MocA family oxidoreductase n=1 Tax=Pelosinus fermentans TaxID=365349 RepID=UPI0002685D99|nr:Gfo/Idh/MocA family oxidoreductase [Pelosinus fermentans]OAM92786.1 oxidoreductase domain protein [Pelosinus fermentans DSM 17108]SDQ56805.1 Oxidoreductase family, NAD-binding Rossmann fold [Pelosinus fermentans]